MSGVGGTGKGAEKIC